MTSSTFPVQVTLRIALLSATVLAVFLARPIWASTSGDADTGEEAQVAGNIILPAWEEGACREQFDIRIWPKATVLWLERENLKALIADPELSEKERNELRWILVMQQAWRKSGS